MHSKKPSNETNIHENKLSIPHSLKEWFKEKFLKDKKVQKRMTHTPSSTSSSNTMVKSYGSLMRQEPRPVSQTSAAVNMVKPHSQPVSPKPAAVNNVKVHSQPVSPKPAVVNRVKVHSQPVSLKPAAVNRVKVHSQPVSLKPAAVNTVRVHSPSVSHKPAAVNVVKPHLTQVRQKAAVVKTVKQQSPPVRYTTAITVKQQPLPVNKERAAMMLQLIPVKSHPTIVKSRVITVETPTERLQCIPMTPQPTLVTLHTSVTKPKTLSALMNDVIDIRYEDHEFKTCNHQKRHDGSVSLTKLKEEIQPKACVYDTHTGKIDDISNGEGSITFELKILLTFDLDNVMCGFIDLHKGDTLSFLLDSSKSEPDILNARLLKVGHRSAKEIQSYLEKLCRKFDKISVKDSIKHCFDRKELVIVILSCPSVWEYICNSPQLTLQGVVCLLKLIIRLHDSSCGFEGHFKQVLNIVACSRFMDSLHGHLKLFISRYIEIIKLRQDSVKKLDWVDQLQTCLQIIVKYIPSKSRAIASLLTPLVKNDVCSTMSVHKLFHELSKTQSNIYDADWHELPALPAIDELLQGPFKSGRNLRPLQITGPYGSGEEYLDTCYRLLRADCFHAISEGIQDYLQDKLDSRDMKIYYDVTVQKINVSSVSGNSGLIIALTFKCDSLIRDSDLKSESLLCLSSNGTFQDAVWATVAQYDQANPNTIVIHLCNDNNQTGTVVNLLYLITFSGHIVMAESPTYYRSYQPVLKGLQTMSGKMAFPDTLVDVDIQQMGKPDYVTKETTLGVQTIFTGYNPCDYPLKMFQNLATKLKTTLDQSQLEAIGNVLNHRVAIVQGPPGTGKTFIGVKALAALLSLSTIPESPILVLTYKNHALDEFLMAVMDQVTDKVVRVGGQSKEPQLEECNIKVLKRSRGRSRIYRMHLDDIHQKVKDEKKKVDDLVKKLLSERIMTFTYFLECLSNQQVANLILDSQYQSNHLTQTSIRSLQAEPKLPLPPDLAAGVQTLYEKWLPPQHVFEQLEKSCSMTTSSPNSDKKRNSKQGDTKDKKENVKQVDTKGNSKQTKDSSRPAFQKWNLDSFITITQPGLQGKKFIPVLYSCAKDMLNSTMVTSLSATSNVWELNGEDRVRLIQYWLLTRIDETMKKLNELLEHFTDLCSQKEELEMQQSVEIMSEMKVIGMTITGASINQTLLAQVKPAIVIVEESAEVMEPQLVAILGNWVQHLIMIGDHEQLRPLVETYKLAKDYKLDVSLMERLIKNQFPYSSLELQNRMRPEFSELLKDIYPKLKDNMERVGKNTKPLCTSTSMYFWTHSHEESGEHSKNHDKSREEQNVHSKCNEEEAKMVIGLALFFIRHGYKPHQVTIIAAYQGQTTIIRKMLKQKEEKEPHLFRTIGTLPLESTSKGSENHANHKMVSFIQTQTLDMFQGDENDIVIISLVRSNAKHAIGFLKERNRRCVAQSRARCGMFFVGNKDTFYNAHNGNSCWRILIDQMAQKNCCGPQLSLCCPRHNVKSQVLATRADDIPPGRFCKEVCKQEMPCGIHKCPEPCQTHHVHDICNEEVPFIFPGCKHLSVRKCHEDISDLLCQEQVDKALPCGHIREISCYLKGKHIVCTESCPVTMQQCQHQCTETCNSAHGHSECYKELEITLKKCGHKVKKKCFQDETKILCKTKVEFQIHNCKHYATKKCHQSVNEIKCTQTCLRKSWKCGHPCKGFCNEACPVKCIVCEEIDQEKIKKQHEAERADRKAILCQVNAELDDIKKKDSTDRIITTLEKTGPTASTYNDIKDRVCKYIQPVHKWEPIVTKIEQVTNLKLKEKWLNAQKKMFDPSKHELKFHGTTDLGIDGITKDGFRLPKKDATNMYGQGVYFATDSSKSAQKCYTQGSDKLLLCDVLLGKTWTVSKHQQHMDRDQITDRGYDSLYAERDTRLQGGVLFDEFVVYNPHQALPKYIIHYTKK